MRNWIPTQIEHLEPFDIVLHASSVWVIQRITRRDYYEIYATRVDDGKQTKWTFHSYSSGYLMQKMFNE